MIILFRITTFLRRRKTSIFSNNSSNKLFQIKLNENISGFLRNPDLLNSIDKAFKGTNVTDLEIEVRNDSIVKHFINGENVLTYTKPQIGGSVDYNEDYWKAKEGTPLKKGYISLQSESHPVEFRNIEILEL